LAGEGSDFLDRADADAVGLAQSAVDSPCLGDSHLSPVDERRNVGWVGVAVSYIPLRSSRTENLSFEGPTIVRWIAKIGHYFNMHAGTATPS
jgi:hypothetical protein